MSQEPLPSRDLPIRNFSIIAHIDHGKTTLTDQLLRTTGSITNQKIERIMDSNPIERERGITIKLAPVRMEYQGFELNLIDTPGHVDFSYEVSRSLAACEGVVLVVDATQGIQAQTLSHFRKAQRLGLSVIPVVNKIDLPSADVEVAVLELMELCGLEDERVIRLSAKTGQGVTELLVEIIARVPAPGTQLDLPLRALLITSYFDQHKGAIALVRVVDGRLTKRQLRFVAGRLDFNPVEIGIFSPEMVATGQLLAGQVGYVATGLKDLRSLKVGDTLALSGTQEVEVLAGYQEPTPMVFMELYPADTAEFSKFKDAIHKLSLRDAAITYHGTHSAALGSGFQVGFLGVLHAEVVLERLKREFGLELIATQPSVIYQVKLKDGQELVINGPTQMPDPASIEETREPVATVTFFTPARYSQVCLDLCRRHRGQFKSSSNLGGQMQIECQIPLAEVISHFHQQLKSLTSGFASMEYSLTGYQPAQVVKVSILLNGEVEEALSFLTVEETAGRRGRAMVDKLKDALPRQMFEVAIQAAIGGKIIARATLKAYRKDVTAKLYGGDVTRRKKLLSKQAKGKKKMKQFGRVELNQDTFVKLLQS